MSAFLSLIATGALSILAGLILPELEGVAYIGGLTLASGIVGMIWTAYLWSDWKRWSRITGLNPKE
jgi:hypothetical protein